MQDVIVIGSGPAGMTAALYTARANLTTKVITGPQLGGQVSITWEVDNYPGLDHNPSGAELTERLVRHVEKFGAELVYDEVLEVDFRAKPLRVTTHSGELEARAVVIASGASAKRLGVPGEEELVGRGVSYCATCDGAFFKGEDVLVVGGGDSALEEALFLTRFASAVTLVHRRDELRAGANLRERAFANPKIGYEWNTVVDEIRGNGKVRQVVLRDVHTDATRERDTNGVFVFIGHYPNSEVFQGKIEMDHHGYVHVDERMMTSVDGVFAAGEIMDPVWRQIATSVGQGCAAGISVENYLGALETPGLV
jgi:thioredoxin reductase (NADPH)